MVKHPGDHGEGVGGADVPRASNGAATDFVASPVVGRLQDLVKSYQALGSAWDTTRLQAPSTSEAALCTQTMCVKEAGFGSVSPLVHQRSKDHCRKRGGTVPKPASHL